MMNTEVTPESLRAHAEYAPSDGMKRSLYVWADSLEREQSPPLPTVPGLYPTIVVERGGESCTGALLRDDKWWVTAYRVGGPLHHKHGKYGTTIRWAEQDGKTPGQTLWEAQEHRVAAWRFASPEVQGEWESMAAAVLAAHGTPTLTPVGKQPEPGTRGLLPVVLRTDGWEYNNSWYVCRAASKVGHAILVDPRSDGVLS